jgi:hypothetical protein
MAKSIKKVFVLEEENGHVYSKLSADNDYGMEMNISDVPDVRIRQPRPTKEKLQTMSEVRPGMGQMESCEEWLEWYKKGMNTQIIDELKLIRKSMKRIQGLVYGIKTADEVLADKETLK